LIDNAIFSRRYTTSPAIVYFRLPVRDTCKS
jgi:hypothetical protein